ncbi:peptidoglycan-binding domain-containing protein, partial [Bacillus manliponensis]|uniref:peptidoglycan-binding domain-containing protein n=1 Tax=Bacillus manliponensis TaxID=574376 RepID=UPI0039EE8F33
MKKWEQSPFSRVKRLSFKGAGKKRIGTLLLAFMLVLSMPATSLAVGKGAKGPDIYVIQGMLKSIGSYAGSISGVYDDTTVAGVKYYQKKHGLPVTGVVDDRTFQSITYTYSNIKMGIKPGGRGKGGPGEGPGAGKGGPGGGPGAGKGGAGAGEGPGAGKGGAGAGEGPGAGKGPG